MNFLSLLITNFRTYDRVQVVSLVKEHTDIMIESTAKPKISVGYHMNIPVQNQNVRAPSAKINNHLVATSYQYKKDKDME